VGGLGGGPREAPVVSLPPLKMAANTPAPSPSPTKGNRMDPDAGATAGVAVTGGASATGGTGSAAGPAASTGASAITGSGGGPPGWRGAASADATGGGTIPVSTGWQAGLGFGLAASATGLRLGLGVAPGLAAKDFVADSLGLVTLAAAKRLTAGVGATAAACPAGQAGSCFGF
jgi:hypothetical protein